MSERKKIVIKIAVINHMADQMIAIDLDDSVKVNYAKFADVLAPIKRGEREMKTIEKYTAGTYRNQGDFKSFIPSMLNDDWQWMDRELNHLLTEASKELCCLNAYSELVPDP